MLSAPSDDEVRDTYAHFGLALYLAQVLEHAIVNAMVAVRLDQRDRLTRSDIDAFMSERFENTLGKLLKALRSELTVPPALDDLLTRALSQRNFLAHHFFRERAQAFLTVSGCEAMQAELRAAQELFSQADKALTALIEPLCTRHGLTEEHFAAAYDALLQDARYRT